MELNWAVFGARQGGHDLLAHSGSREIAAAIAQFTDRPGDPPPDSTWGPADSGFMFSEHYICLRTVPDLEAGRAGMVRSYAAFIPLNQIGNIRCLADVFAQLPTSIVPASSLSVKIIETAAPLAESEIGGVMDLANSITKTDLGLPLLWISEEPYLPVIDVLWRRLPSCLRRRFCFAFQFDPEHKLPREPQIIATLSQLKGRWVGSYSATIAPSSMAPPSPAARWLADDVSASKFSDRLQRMGIVDFDFSDLELLSQLVEIVEMGDSMRFRDALKGVRILEKHLKKSARAAPYQIALLKDLSALVQSATSTEIAALRNLDDKVLIELIPLLKEEMQRWLGDPQQLSELPGLIAIALREAGSWWSNVVLDWARTVCASRHHVRMDFVYLLVLAQEDVFEFVISCLPLDDRVEANAIKALPAKLSERETAQFSRMAVRLSWLRLHAVVMLRSQEFEMAVVSHALVAQGETVGLDQLISERGAQALISFASKVENEAIDRYVADLLPVHSSMLSIELLEKGRRWASLLCLVLARNPDKIDQRLRSLIVEVIETDLPDPAAQQLAGLISTIDVSVWSEMKDPLSALDRLLPEQAASIVIVINEFIKATIAAADRSLFPKFAKLYPILDQTKVAEGLKLLAITCYVDVGINFFECMPSTSDDLIRGWLIELFTRTYPQGLTGEQATRLAGILCAGDCPRSAEVIRDTVEQYHRIDAEPILDRIRYKYRMAKPPPPQDAQMSDTLPIVLMVTALPLERREVVSQFGLTFYDQEIQADVGQWPSADPRFEIWHLTTGAGNLDALSSTIRVIHKMRRKPSCAFFIGVGGGIKDSDIGDVVYSTKVYHYEGGKEEGRGVKSRPNVEHSSEALVQLAIRVAERRWQPQMDGETQAPKATAAVIASGEKVLASTKATAKNYKRIKETMNDAQVVDMESFGFLKACRQQKVENSMVLRGVSDKLAEKAESDARGNQPLAVRNAVAFLAALLDACANSSAVRKKKGSKRKKFLGLF